MLPINTIGCILPTLKESAVTDNPTRFDSVSANDSGQSMTDAAQLDGHYQLARAEYDRAIASVGFQPGWRVLDAGCGNGVFLPHLSRIVGPGGTVLALDHSDDSLNAIAAWVNKAPANIEIHKGGVTALPLDDASVDGVWCANVSQYLSDAELDRAVGEFVRVTRPGGLIAIKEFDNTLWQWHPVDPRLKWRLLDANVAAGETQATGAMRSWGVSRWMRARGLEIVKREGVLVEVPAPLPESTILYLANVFRWIASSAPRLPLSDTDKAEWARLSANIEDVLRDPDALYREMFTVTVGRVPTYP